MGDAWRCEFPNLWGVAQRALDVLAPRRRTLEAIVLMVENAEAFAEDYYKREIDTEIARLKRIHVAVHSDRRHELSEEDEADYVDSQGMFEPASKLWGDDLVFVGERSRVPSIANQMTFLETLRECIGRYEISDDETLIGATENEYYAAWALRRIADAISHMNFKPTVDYATATAKDAYERGSDVAALRFCGASRPVMEGVDAVCLAENLKLLDRMNKKWEKKLVTAQADNSHDIEVERSAWEQRLTEERRARSLKALEMKKLYDRKGKHAAKKGAYGWWKRWQEAPDMYDSKTGFARAMMDKWPALENQKKITDWCRNWERGIDIPDDMEPA
ncbi:hypothetical protein [Paraburkholderia tagetis]|uniref:Uncharacterized protein n=1 Tax=Paraburkholderia tagetis TaxID=2913261 RepID=A0A9X1RMW0_9BURK|nr:hypothetical protein [Paraburkholderia tagetis]MCG5073049.1 hypothetical protein [Paraburkholderia tagetis]